MSAFKSYDFRGVYGKDFDLSTVYKFGFFLPELLNADKVLIGRDMRISTPEIFESLCCGINDAGADVYDMGLCTTPMVYYFTAKHHFPASIMITASHNPKEYNGLKVSRAEALPCGFDTGLGELEKMVNTQTPVVHEKKGKIINYSVTDEYLDFLRKYQYDISNLKIVMDCSNGMASMLVKNVFGSHPIYLYDQLDGNFPHHDPNPLEKENIVDLQKTVLKEKADVGVIFDGDADRVMFVDEAGNFIPPDLMIALIGCFFAEQYHEGIYIQDIRTSKSVSEYLERFSFSPYTWRVGRAHAALKLREIDGIFGGEFAGHYYFRDFFYSDSAMLASLIILRVISQMKEKGIIISQLINKIAIYANSGEINFKINRKEEAMTTLKNYFTAQEKMIKFLDFDGYRIEFEDWWFNIRPSNTEPYLRLLIEAKNEKLLREKLTTANKLLEPFLINTSNSDCL